MFSPEDAVVGKPLRDVAQKSGANAKRVKVVYHSDVDFVNIYDVWIQKGFFSSRTGILIGLELRKNKHRFDSFLASYRIPFLDVQELGAC